MAADLPSLRHIAARIATYRPRLTASDGHDPAATALVVCDQTPPGPRVLFIERVSRSTDRWSGQMALPGGRREPGDRDLAATAVRETREEVGVDLPAAVGRLDDLPTVISNVVVATFVFVLEAEPALVPDPAEVNDVVWIPIAELEASEAATTHWHRGRGPFPALRYGRYTIWGLTYRIVTRFLRLIR